MTDDLKLLRQSLSRIGRIVVLAGGRSAERQISLQSGNAVLQALRNLGVVAELVDPAETPVDTLRRYDRAFIALHGRGGEDGVIQGVLEHLQIPYTGSGVMASAIGMDKQRTKLLWRGADLPTPDFWMANNTLSDVRYPVIVKPSHEGSSIGMCRAGNAAELVNAVARASEYDQRVLIEQWVDGPEFTVAILGTEALPAIRLETPNVFYDYEAKYQSTSTRYLCPCGLSENEEQQLKSLALDAFHSLGCRGWGRVDVMLDKTSGFQLLEINTIPGMTDHSLVPMAATHQGLSFEALVARILLEGGDAND